MDAAASPQPEDFAPFSPETLSRPQAFWAALRRDAPVYRVPGPAGQRPMFMISRRADVQKVALAPELFSSEVPSDLWRWGDLGPELQPLITSLGWGIVHTIASADPPLHGLYRKIVSPGFMPGSVKQLLPKLQASIDELLDALPVGAPFDFMRDFAVPLPIAMIGDMLGLPIEDRERIHRCTDVFVALVDLTTPDAEVRSAVARFAEGQHYLAGHIARCQASPDGSLISAIANAVDGAGAPLSMEERLSLCYLMMAAGNETTRNALALSAYYLATIPGLWAALKADVSLVPIFIEEVLRLGTPAVLNPRVVMRDTELEGVAIPAGAIVFLLWGSANRDEASFAHADTIRLDRANPRNHQAFGYGIHSCVGAPLARQELVLSVTAWLRRYDSMRLAVPEDAVVPAPLFGFRTFAELPIIVEPAAG